MKFKRDSKTINPSIFAKINSIGINITQGGSVELRVNNKVEARLKIEIKEDAELTPQAEKSIPVSQNEM